MDAKNVSRRSFMGGMAAALSYVGSLKEVLAQGRGQRGASPQGAPGAGRGGNADVPAVRLSSNENPYGIAENVKQAMTDSFKYGHLYGAPDGGLGDALLAYHPGIKKEHILFGS